ncbi:hypothetical protein SAMN05216556_13512 [Aequorivita viscosa]|nr:hypothetical protein SAMN05216556_13512 [Aequorivita viscosa]
MSVNITDLSDIMSYFYTGFVFVISNPQTINKKRTLYEL